MKHRIDVPAAGTLEELGTEVARLRYDAMFVFLTAFRDEIERQREADASKNHERMHFLGSYLVQDVHMCMSHVLQMLKVSLPHMTEETEAEPTLVDIHALP